MRKTCIPCNAVFEGDICKVCYNSAAVYYEIVGEYKGKNIMKFSYESGYRVDFGTVRSKMVPTIEEAQRIVDYR